MFLSAVVWPPNKTWGSELIDKSCMEICRNNFLLQKFQCDKTPTVFRGEPIHHHECHHQSPHKRLQTFLCPPILPHHNESLLLSLLFFKTLYNGRVKIWDSRVNKLNQKWENISSHVFILQQSESPLISTTNPFLHLFYEKKKIGGVLNKSSLRIWKVNPIQHGKAIQSNAKQI